MNSREQKKGALYLIPSTLYENTQDMVINLQTRETLRHIEYLLVENIRSARRFISSLKIGREIDSYVFEQLDKNTPAIEATRLMQPLLEGKDGGIISEAGCPGIADPGSLAVEAAHRLDIRVVPLSGPSSIMLALMASGFNGQKFSFHGYLPIDKVKRASAIQQLEKNAKKFGETQIFMETPYRNNQMLADVIKSCNGGTRLCIAKSLTGEHEWIKTKTIDAWSKDVPDLHKEPVIFIIFKSI